MFIFYTSGSSPNTVEFDATLDSNFQNDTAPPIWCLACRDNLVIAGCGNGRIEVKTTLRITLSIRQTEPELLISHTFVSLSYM